MPSAFIFLSRPLDKEINGVILLMRVTESRAARTRREHREEVWKEARAVDSETLFEVTYHTRVTLRKDHWLITIIDCRFSEAARAAFLYFKRH